MTPNSIGQNSIIVHCFRVQWWPYSLLSLSCCTLLLFLCLSLLVLANEKKGGWFIFEPILVVYVCDKRFYTVRDDF